MNSDLTFGDSPSASTPIRRIEDQGSYIDDYSHLRLSYYQEYQVQDGDDNSRDLWTLHDDCAVSSGGEHGLERSTAEVSQNAAINDDENCGTSIISLLSTSPAYSSFEFVEHFYDSQTTQESPQVSTISDSPLPCWSRRTSEHLGPVQGRSSETNEYLGPIQKWPQETKKILPPVHEESWRKKLRNSFLASDVILPHPSQVAAGMIATASRRAGGHQFQYNDRVEPGSKLKMEMNCDDSIVFDPKRRSTLKYNYFM